jgi:hypothetical protein
VALPLSTALRQASAELKLISGAKDALAISRRQLGDTGYRHRSLHPSFSDAVIHPDNLLGLLPLLQEDFLLATKRRRLREVSAHLDVTSSISNSLLLVGGPAGEGVTRIVFGYKEGEERESGRSLFCNGLGLALPYHWNLDQDHITAVARRFVSGATEPVARPNWGLIGPHGRRLYPTLDNDDFLKTDYLLLTKLPNFLADESRGSESYIVSFGGTHGPGQIATKLLLSSRATIKRLVSELKIDTENVGSWPEAYQAVFRIGDIDHRPRRGSVGTTIKLVDTLQVVESRDWWRSWGNRVEQRLKNWLDDTAN